MMDHAAFSDLAARSIDGWLTPDESLEFEMHLRACADCRALLADLRANEARLAGIGPMQTSPALRRRVLAATHRRARPVWLLVAAALLVLAAASAAIAVGAYVTRQFERPAIELSVDWQAIPAGDLAPAASTSRIRAVVAGPHGFVAVGSAGGKAATWTSKDGVRWPRSPDLPGGDGAELTTVETGGPGFITAGRSGAAGAIWTSTDGVIWDPAGPAAAFPQAVVNLVRPFDDGWIAAGAAVGPTGLTGATWTSTDGVEWKATIPLDAVGGNGNDPANVAALFRRPDGIWIAYPQLTSEAPYGSVDGLEWHLTDDRIPDRTRVRDVRQDGATIVAIDDDTLLWSTDGLAWSISPMTPTLDGQLGSLDVDERGFVALVTGPTGSFAYRSEDGRAFVREPSSIGGVGSTAYDVATFAGTEVAVGIDGGSGAIWSRTR